MFRAGPARLLSLIVALAVSVSACGGSSPTPVETVSAICGNGHVEGDEQCDDGGVCIGGANAGTVCTREGDCVGDGVCQSGAHLGRVCSADSECIGSRCVHCVTFGGDGCAANCTRERQWTYQFNPGVIQGLSLKEGTAGFVMHAAAVTVPVKYTGDGKLVLGSPRSDGLVPFVLPATDVHIPRLTVTQLVCGCVRGVALQTCGGTLFERDGAFSPSCSDGFAGKVACPSERPCTFAHGAGNAAAGQIECGTPQSTGADIDWLQDAGGEDRRIGSIETSLTGTGMRGFVLLAETWATGIVWGACLPSRCTDAEPIADRGSPVTFLLTTGTASAQIRNANAQDGGDVGPFAVTGTPVSCDALQAHSMASTEITLVGAYGALDQPTLGDIVVTQQFPGQLIPLTQ